MTKRILMAAVAALAITAPAQAEKGGKHGGQDQAAQAATQEQQPQARSGGHQQREQRQQQAQSRPQFEQRARPERQVFQQQRFEQRARPQRQMQVFEQRVQRAPRVDNRARFQERFDQRQERQARQFNSGKQFRQQQLRTERVANQGRIERQARAMEFRGRRAIEHAQVADHSFKQQLKQQRQAERFALAQQRFDRRSAQIENRATRRALFAENRGERWNSRPEANVGQRLNVTTASNYAPVNQDWYGDYAAQRYRSLYSGTPDRFYDYNYNDGYLYQADRSGLVTGLFPILGGAFGVGQILPAGYSSYNVPYGYRSLYYDTPDYSYRYGDGAIYRVDPDTQVIQAVVALLTGQSFGVGQMLPMGYDVYNVPYAYRDQYHDTDDMWYRYDDGYIYGIDPYSRMIQDVFPVSYGGYAVGYPAPTYASYGYPSYAVPYAYDDLYYGAPGYNYQYANGGIYQVDPTTQIVSALVALVTGQNLGIGQMLPLGYDAYNVPYAYRSSYYDTPSTIYRYDDGYIYGANPRTRVIETVVPVAYNGFAVGYPVPADYPGYAVPPLYSDLYYAQPGFDYRYANGGIYQLDPQTRIVEAIAALLTGQTFGVGQMLPAGYDAYNVPYAYRSQYFDTADNWYRYADGNIYQVDPRTRVVQTVIAVA
jgi:hypothetical protein